jgi:OOP family OmpA-OmpF porin
MRLILYFSLLCILPFSVRAQATWEIGLGCGLTGYAGDMNASRLFDYKETRPGYTAFLRRHFNPNLALRFNYLGGQLAGDDRNFSDPAWRQMRAFRFTALLQEASLLLEWDLLGQHRLNGFRFRRILSPYLFAGPGLAMADARTDYNDFPEPNPALNNRAGIAADREAPRNAVEPVIHLGGGLKLDLGRYLLLGAEIGLRPTFSDYWDGVSQAGSPQNNDWYVFGGLALSYRLPEKDTDRDWIPNRKDRCPLAAGLKKMKGCPDADEDGLADDDDACPELFGVLSGRGCPDADGDSVPDSLDNCPQQSGLVIHEGCPDKDADGVADIDDACPDRPGVAALLGCPDEDADGVADHVDTCPTEGGQVAANGCPDRDADGLDDRQDKCPDQKGLAAFAGCPDTDEDGIEDEADRCPAVKGVAAFAGCPDTDSDGIQDSLDRCPDKAGVVRFAGCPDTDQDGIEDAEDKCPTVIGIVAEKGCPLLRKEDKKAIVAAVRNIQFETGSATLTAASGPVLEHLAEVLKGYPNYRVAIHGHTDSKGSDKANLKLSEQRALRCVEFLTEKGVARERLGAKGFGERKPLVSNKTPKGRAKNRRVEFVMVKG